MRLKEMAWLSRKHSFLLGFLVSYMPLARSARLGQLKKRAARTRTARFTHQPQYIRQPACCLDILLAGGARQVTPGCTQHTAALTHGID